MQHKAKQPDRRRSRNAESTVGCHSSCRRINEDLEVGSSGLEHGRLTARGQFFVTCSTEGQTMPSQRASEAVGDPSSDPSHKTHGQITWAPPGHAVDRPPLVANTTYDNYSENIPTPSAFICIDGFQLKPISSTYFSRA